MAKRFLSQTGGHTARQTFMSILRVQKKLLILPIVLIYIKLKNYLHTPEYSKSTHNPITPKRQKTTTEASHRNCQLSFTGAV